MLEIARTDSFVASALARADPGRPALVAAGETLTYSALRQRIDERRDLFDLGERALVVLSGSNSIEFVVTYLSLQCAGHVPLVAGRHVDRLTAAWNPAIVVHTDGATVEVDRRHDEGRELHPDLALLLSTSGSTGASKLVRLSQANLSSNARAIGEYLRLTDADRGITSLPLHYCYGLSILHSHLAAGASVVLTDASVVDPCFASALGEHGVTNVAGVPHSFELLERAGPERLHVPTLRFITQAGGRLAPDLVARWLERSARWGVEFFVMYGQTEATARIAYLPPAMASTRPGAIGVPIPGGELEVRHVDGLDGGFGELVYRGPNVMMGYASTDADLAERALLTELRTGDLGRYDAEAGVFEVVGRRSRFVKPFGVRVDLDQVEQAFAAEVAEIAVAGDDEHLVVVAPGCDVDALRHAVSEEIGLPAALVVVDGEGAVPRTESGKTDYDAVLRTGRGLHDATTSGALGGTGWTSVAGIYAAVLGRSDVTAASTFVALGGDSLNYVECSLRLERLLGHLPQDWHVTAVADLDAGARRRRTSRLDTTVVLRAVAICAIVSTHMGLFYVPGGAHLLLAVVGFNLSRFHMPITATFGRVRAGLRTVARAAIPTAIWVGGGMLFAGTYSVGALFLVNNYVGPRGHDDGRWHFWFIEVFAHLVVLTTLLLAIPAVRRVERRFPYWFPLGLFFAALVLRWEWAHMGDDYNLRFRTHGVAWFFVLGWLVHRSNTWWQRILTSVLCVMTVPDFFERPQRDWFIAAGILLLVWLRDVPAPRVLLRPLSAVAAASMWILITHFGMWPLLEDAFAPGVAYVLTIAAGVATWAVAEWLTRAVGRTLRERRLLLPARQVSSLVTSTATT